MNQTQRIYNMLAKSSKTDLNRQVKFAIADEAADALRQMDDAAAELEEVSNNTQSTINDIVRSLEAAIGLAPGLDGIQESLDTYNAAFQKANEIADKFKQASEALGVDPYQSDAFSELVDAIEQSGTITFDAMKVRDDAKDLSEAIANIQSSI